MSGKGKDVPAVNEMAFPVPNRVDMEWGPAWLAGLRPDAPWKALPATIIANLGKPFGDIRFL